MQITKDIRIIIGERAVEIVLEENIKGEFIKKTR